METLRGCSCTEEEEHRPPPLQCILGQARGLEKVSMMITASLKQHEAPLMASFLTQEEDEQYFSSELTSKSTPCGLFYKNPVKI